MKQLLFVLILAPSLAFAGGSGSGVNLSDYNINTTPAASPSPQAANTSVSDRGDDIRRTYFRRGYGPTGYRSTLQNVNDGRGYTYLLNGVEYADYRDFVDAVNALPSDLSAYDLGTKTYTTYEAFIDAVTSLLRGQGIYFLNGQLYPNYWAWVTAYRASNNDDAGVTRSTTQFKNYGNAYELSTGLEPVDPKDNTYRGLSREEVRQSAAKAKLMRLRGY